MDLDAEESQRFHDRAERSGNEARKTILGLSSGALGILSVALTGKIEPPLSIAAMIFVVGGALMFGTSVLLGIAIWKFDAQSAYFRARAISAKDKAKKTSFYEKCLRRTRWKRRAGTMQPMAFAIGVIAITVFTILRAVASF